MYIETKQIEALYQALTDYDTIILHRHLRPDPDALGSQLGLKTLIQDAFPNKRVLAAGTTTKGLAFLGEMDDVKAEDYDDALVIILDTANLPRVDGRYYQKGAKLIKIDHHIVVDEYGDLQIVYPEASSASELVTLISLHLGDRLPMSQDAARLLYSGILGDTGRFLYSTTPDTFKAASALLSFDLDVREISDAFQVMSMNEAKFHGFAYNNLTINDSGLAYLIITQDDLVNCGITEEQTNSVVNLPSNIEGVYTWVTFIEQKGRQPKWRIRIRSKGPAINEIAGKYGGGGHAMASGAKAHRDEEISQLIGDLSKATQAYKDNHLL